MLLVVAAFILLHSFFSIFFTCLSVFCLCDDVSGNRVWVKGLCRLINIGLREKTDVAILSRLSLAPNTTSSEAANTMFVSTLYPLVFTRLAYLNCVPYSSVVYLVVASSSLLGHSLFPALIASFLRFLYW